MYTFHLEAVVEDAANAKHPDAKMTKVLKEVKDAGMYAGVALKPKTPIETLFPYIEDKLIDQVSKASCKPCLCNCNPSLGALQALWYLCNHYHLIISLIKG